MLMPGNTAAKIFARTHDGDGCWFMEQAESLPSSAAAIHVAGPGEDGEPDVVGPPATRASLRYSHHCWSVGSHERAAVYGHISAVLNTHPASRLIYLIGGGCGRMSAGGSAWGIPDHESLVLSPAGPRVIAGPFESRGLGNMFSGCGNPPSPAAACEQVKCEYWEGRAAH
jgi:hypothetical protein